MKRRGVAFLWLWAAALSWMLLAARLRELAEAGAGAEGRAEGAADGVEGNAAGPGAAGGPDSRDDVVEGQASAPEGASGTARGRVLDGAGDGVGGAWVWYAGRLSGRVRTAGDGSFAVPVAAGTFARVWCLGREARADGGGALCLGTDEVRARPGDTDLILHAEWHEVAVRPPATVITVLSPAGEPIPNVWVSVPGCSDRADASGKVEFRNLVDVPFQPTVTWENARTAEDEGWVLPVTTPIRPRHSYVLQCRLGMRLEGRLVDSDGLAAPGRAITVHSGETCAALGRTDDRGEFSLLLDPFPPVPYRVTAASADGARWIEFEQDLLPGRPPVSLRLPEGE